MTPMIKEPSCFGRDTPVSGVGKRTPLFDQASDFIDNRRWVIFLVLGRKAFVVCEQHALLALVPLGPLPALGDWGIEIR